jgi:hypothetical protein
MLGAAFPDSLVFEVNPLIQDLPFIKVENGFVVVYSSPVVSLEKAQIEVFNKVGAKVQEINLFKFLPNIPKITIWDVSINEKGAIAIAANNSHSIKPFASYLIIINSDGKLQSLSAMPLEQGVFKLEIDKQGNVWTVGFSCGAREPSLVPLIYEYGPKGEILGKFIKRSKIPAHSKYIQQGREYGGVISFGVTKSQVWIWFPLDNILVIMKKDGTNLQKIETGVPTTLFSMTPADTVNKIEMGPCYLVEPGRLVAQMLTNKATSALCDYKLRLNKWRKLDDPPKGFLVGCDDGRLAWASRPSGRVKIEWTTIPN